jgi:hypothetical protein
MLAERDHRARLRAFGALGMLRNKTHLVTDGQLFKPAVHNAVSMEVDLIALSAEDEAAILLRKEPRDPPMVGHRMQFDVTPPLTNMVFEQPARGVKSVVDRDVDILVRVMRRGIAPDDDLVSRNFEIDTHPKQIALLAARVPALNNDPAGYDSVKEAFELRGTLSYSGRDGV